MYQAVRLKGEGFEPGEWKNRNKQQGVKQEIHTILTLYCFLFYENMPEHLSLLGRGASRSASYGAKVDD